MKETKESNIREKAIGKRIKVAAKNALRVIKITKVMLSVQL